MNHMQQLAQEEQEKDLEITNDVMNAVSRLLAHMLGQDYNYYMTGTDRAIMKEIKDKVTDLECWARYGKQ